MGRGSSKVGGDGKSLSGGGSGENINVKSQTDVWSFRHTSGNEAFVDAINTSVRDMERDFPGLMNSVNSVNSATLGGADRTKTLGFYNPDAKSVSLNDNYVNIDKMNNIYDKSGNYHPSRGNKSGTQAVAYHEMGHALSDHLKDKYGAKDLDAASKQIVNNAYKSSKGTGGTLAWAGNISKYAQKNYAECVAEAVSDWYCNGRKAKTESKAIVKEMKRAAKS